MRSVNLRIGQAPNTLGSSVETGKVGPSLHSPHLHLLATCSRNKMLRKAFPHPHIPGQYSARGAEAELVETESYLQTA
jgi:hypothetical protein